MPKPLTAKALRVNQHSDSIEILSSRNRWTRVVDPPRGLAPNITATIAGTAQHFTSGTICSHRFGDTDGKHTFLCIAEMDLFSCCGALEYVLTIDDVLSSLDTKRIAASFLEDGRRFLAVFHRGQPLVLGNDKGIGTGGSFVDNASMRDDTSSLSFGPPIPIVDLSKGHPKPTMMRVIMFFPFDGVIEGITSGHLLLIRPQNGPQDRLGARSEPIGSQQLTIMQNIDAIGVLFQRELRPR